MSPDNFRANIPDSLIGENFELFTDVTEGIKEQITDVFSPAEGMFPVWVQGLETFFTIKLVPLKTPSLVLMKTILQLAIPQSSFDY